MPRKISWLSVLSVDHAQQVFQKMPNQSKMRTGVLNREKTNISSESEMTFGRTDYLKMHMAKHSRVRTHTCVQCQKSFGRAHSLKRHMVTHSGEKTHTCSECKKSSRTFEGTHDHPQQSFCSMPKVIWSNYIFKKTHAHSQWSEGPLLLRM